MRGKHHIILETSHLKYDFVIRRNITVIRGDSATGKTTLIMALQDYSRNPINGPIRLMSDVPIAVVSDDGMWKEIIEKISNSIIFIDEEHSFIRTKEFAEIVRKSTNYFVLITRENLKTLPYSVNEIYGIRTSGKYNYPQQIYHELYQIYEARYYNEVNEERVLIVEDSKSGLEFYRCSCDENVKCISSDGNSNLLQVLDGLDSKNKITVIADGAAFGAMIEKLLRIAKTRGNIQLYLPESFEWLILKSDVIGQNVKQILEEPEEYIDSALYFSWERFLADYLEKITADDVVKKYTKKELKDYYKTDKIRSAILKQVPLEVRNFIASEK